MSKKETMVCANCSCWQCTDCKTPNPVFINNFPSNHNITEVVEVSVEEDDQSAPVQCYISSKIGCGKENSVGTNFCKDCGRSLWSIPDSNGKRRYLGEIIYFFQKNNGIVEKGIIISFPQPSSGDVQVRYYDKQYCYERYDEITNIDLIFTSIHDVDVYQKCLPRKQRTLNPITCFTDGMSVPKK